MGEAPRPREALPRLLLEPFDGGAQVLVRANGSVHAGISAHRGARHAASIIW